MENVGPTVCNLGSVLIEAVAVLDAAEELDLAAKQVLLARQEEVLHVRVLVIDGAPRARHDLEGAEDAEALGVAGGDGDAYAHTC